MKKLSDRARNHLGTTIEIKWGTSRGRDTYGYTTATLYDGFGRRRAGCNGGGYDMRGTVVGNWIASTFADELRKIKLAEMPMRSHWEPDGKRVCEDRCKVEAEARFMAQLDKAPDQAREPLVLLPGDCFECPTCGGSTRASWDGKRIEDGRSLYGLTFHDPNYDPGKAVVGKDCSNRSLGGESGKTVAELEKEGTSLGLERYQAIYRASSKHATKRHTIPSIDGACGFETVRQILQAIGLDLQQIVNRTKLDVYQIVEADKPRRPLRRKVLTT